MADKNYIVLTPLRQAASKRGEAKTVPPGSSVTMDEALGQPLVDCGALRESDVLLLAAE